MKKFLILFVLLTLPFHHAKAEEWGSIELTGIKQDFTLDQLKGNYVLMLFWATWCPYCKNQMPALSLLKKQYKSESKLKILAVSIDDGNAIPLVSSYLTTNNLTNLPVIIDKKSKLFKSMGFYGVPTLVFLNKQGKILGVYSGLQKFDIEYLNKVLRDDA